MICLQRSTIKLLQMLDLHSWRHFTFINERRHSGINCLIRFKESCCLMKVRSIKTFHLIWNSISSARNSWKSKTKFTNLESIPNHKELWSNYSYTYYHSSSSFTAQWLSSQNWCCGSLNTPLSTRSLRLISSSSRICSQLFSYFHLCSTVYSHSLISSLWTSIHLCLIILIAYLCRLWQDYYQKLYQFWWSIMWLYWIKSLDTISVRIQQCYLGFQHFIRECSVLNSIVSIFSTSFLFSSWSLDYWLCLNLHVNLHEWPRN